MQHKNYSNIQRACNFRLILQTPHYRLVFFIDAQHLYGRAATVCERKKTTYVSQPEVLYTTRYIYI